ncbi:App1 family protein [Psychroserpens sp. XS_ASV72]|uniref:App1 family protein n=1 Tax=Psychroserpens sp. XS_ASV72 TaxID=3241293 RepID=UPI003514F4AB
MSWLKKDPLQIISFKSYGTKTHFYCRGRALEDEAIDLEQKGLFGLFLNSWKRFETDEIKYANLEVLLPNGKRLETTTDDHGYFRIDTQIQDMHTMVNEEGWLNFEWSFSDEMPKRTIQRENRFPGSVLIPSEASDFGVISDIDDTILHTGVVSTLKWRVLVNSIFRSASSRMPLEGTSEFYHKLHRGPSGKNANPIFYVSHSPWNMYRYLDFFLKQNKFPKGPILLRSFKDIFSKKANEKAQKHIEILQILKTYPRMQFILIGDSGEHDADIYMEVAKAHPEQVKAIYLQRVNHKKKMLRVASLFANFDQIPVLLIEDSAQAMTHARTHGFIE